ncbi:MAG TPA: CBS domain-containing protein [Pyrinomonadaceae bacterium]|jgi:CBS domain-containing protein/gamma-glutamyl:cysteine ligase YbdK (ATP-grasp superfamily)|nr:CBS domain-containing protein [Pyrinomonadaceae bacterium]
MGEHKVEQHVDEKKSQAFMKALLDDLRALAFMLEDGRVESGTTRIGAEQEMFLIDRYLRPAPVSLEVLAQADDQRLTTEIARFNLEANLTPLELTGNCFTRMQDELETLLELARKAAATQNADVLLSGILPTLLKSDLTLDNLTPVPRYHELNRGVIRLRGGPLSIHIKGLDELHLTHDNIMMESCNTSFQVHFQTNAKDFANHYNIAQAITGPVLAAAVNSPLLFGQRLWQETRVALFQHSTDERSRPQLARNQPTRVAFGDCWLRNSVVELFHEQITRFRSIILIEPNENPFEVLARGETPSLSALRLHNGTVWRWNRACYGVTEGVPHLRIENRAFPSGPTVVDEIANAAFFTGLMAALPEVYGDITKRMEFDNAKSNFFRAARHGLDAQFQWIDGESHSAPALILDHLLPLARQGLMTAGVATEDVDKYLDIVRERTQSRQTGANWIVKSIAAMDNSTSKDTRHRKLTSAMLANQKSGQPVHRWSISREAAPDEWGDSYRTIGQFMSTDLFTVKPGDLIDLAASVMDWRHIRHVPVEDEEGRLIGLVTHRGLLRILNLGNRVSRDSIPITVREVMIENPVTVSPSTSSLEAIQLMRSNRVGCLPVVENDQLVGIVTSYDFLEASARLFQQHLGATDDKKESRSRAQGV